MEKENQIIIREAVKSDIPRLIELYEQLIPNDPYIELNSAITAWEKAVNNGVIYFVAEYGGKVAAACYIAIIPNITKQCKPIGFIENVVTDSEYRRLGIGRKLLGETVNYAKSRGCYKAVLQSGNKRTEAHKFYESIGFDGDSKRAFEIRF